MKHLLLIGIFFHFCFIAEAQTRKSHHHHPYSGSILYQNLNSCKSMPAYRKPDEPSKHRQHAKKGHHAVIANASNTSPTASTGQGGPAQSASPAKTPVTAQQQNTTANSSSPQTRSDTTKHAVTAPPAVAVVEKKEPIIAKDTIPTHKQEENKNAFENLAKPTTEKPLELPPINFVFNQDELAVANMDSFIQAVEYAQNGYLVLIEGHTDDRGDNDYNLKLSMKRVQRIKQLMMDMGVSDESISVVGHGETQPLVGNDTEANRLINRRIEFKVFKIN